MNYTRRDLSLLLPALAVAGAADAQQNKPQENKGQEKKMLPSKVFPYADLPVKINGENKSRAVLDGTTHTGFPIEVHMTELAPGSAPHPPHHHVDEEMVLVKNGTLDVTINGATTRIGPGGSAYVNSGEEHGWKNVGTDRAEYFVIAFGPKA